MRNDNLARALDHSRWPCSTLPSLPAIELYNRRESRVTGKEVAQTYGVLAHYTTWYWLERMISTGRIGGKDGCYLTPTPYAACMAPYNLGLDSPRELCLLINVSQLSELYGPGIADPDINVKAPGIWLGGAIEFFYSGPLNFFDVVMQVHEIAPCGDRHSGPTY